MEQLIIKALKSACGNRNIKFQVIVQDDRLHIYANHREDYQPNHLILEENVRAAIASLALGTINSLWLYTRPLSQVEPNWQVFIELPTQDKDEIEDTNGNTDSNLDDLEHPESEINSEIDSEIEPVIDIEGIGNFDLPTSGTTGDAGLLFDCHTEQKTLLQEEIESTDVVSFTEANRNGDTGLLQDRGLIHGSPLKETEIYAVSTYLSDTTEAANFSPNNNLAQYCFIDNPELLTGTKVSPSKTVMRLVKFFHYLSNSDQQQLPPILESYLREGVIQQEEISAENSAEEISPAIQNWLKQIGALDEKERSAFALWLSCYCFDPTATLEELKTISAQNQNTPQMKIKQANRSTLYGFVPVNDDSPEPSTRQDQLDELNELDETKFQLPSMVKKLDKKLLPGIWILTTTILIILGIISHNSQIVTTSAQTSALCKNTIGSLEYCRLAVDLAGEKAIAQTPKNLFPLTEETESVAAYGCARYANLKAGIAIAKIAPKTTPVISSHGEKIFPHIYVVEAEQKKAKQLGNIKVGCVYTTGQGQRSPKKLAADLIPLNWPREQYRQQTEPGKNLSFGIFTNPINLGLSTIFAALGIAIAAWLNLGLKINHTHTIYLVALILGMVQLATTLLMPANLFGLLGAIAFPSLTIAIVSLLLKDFQLNWKRGYASIAISVLAIVAVQFLFYSLCLSLIAGLI
ncbi:MAG: hypothetical protein RLZZ574_3359 [Cyanobacteriota bacterium]|jgi:hypothetical protein